MRRPAGGRRGAVLRCAVGALVAPFSLLAPRSSLHAQTLREYLYERPYRGETQLRAVIAFGAGTLTLRPGSGSHLYRMALRYDAERFRPTGSYAPKSGEVRMGLTSTGGGIRVTSRRGLAQDALIELPRSVELSLDLSFGATEATLDLGGLRLTDLVLQTGASTTEVTFSVPNPARCRSAEIRTGAAELIVRGLGNAGCARWAVKGGVGAVTLELDGDWPADARLQLEMAMGEVTIRVPRSLGVRLTLDRFLTSFSPEGFTRRGATYTSTNYGAASRRVDIQVKTALGEVAVEWTGP